MASVFTHTFSHQAALRHTVFQNSLKRATHPLQRALIITPLRARPLSSHVTLRRSIVALGTGLAGTGLGLTFYANLQRLNCECESIFLPGYDQQLRTAKATAPASQPRSKATSGSSDSMTLPPPPESTVNMYELTFGTVCGVCAGIFVKKGAKALGFIFGGIFVILQVSRHNRTRSFL